MLKDPSVSRNHALLIVTPSSVALKDLGSTNGVYVNGRRVEGELALAEGDTLSIGETDLELARTVLDEGTSPGLVASERSGMLCPHCGTAVPVTAPVCTVCGKSLAEDSLAVAAAQTEEKEVAKVERAAVSASPPRVPPALREPEPAPNEPAAPAAADTGELLPSLDDFDELAAPLETSVPEAPGPPRAGAAPAMRTPGAPAPRPFTRAPTGRTPAERPEPAGFLPRLGAVVLDGLLIGVVATAGSLAAGGPGSADGNAVMWILSSCLGVLVPIFGWTLWGTTPGKRLLGLWVCELDGTVGIGAGKAILRFVGYVVSTLAFGVGFLMVAFTPARRGLHDVFAGTYVGRRP